jgi:hypothetical protein
LVDVNQTLLNDSEITSVTVDLNSIDYIRFAANVSWSQPNNPTGGYEVRVRDEYFLIQCFCVSDPSLRGLNIDDSLAYPPFTYRSGSSGVITVEILPLADLSEGLLGANGIADWPSTCLDINHSSATCGLPVYNSPSGVVVSKHPSRSSASEQALSVHWQYQTSFGNPTLYYIEVYNVQDIREFYTFAVDNTNSVVIDHLAASTQYYVHVQSYMHCSGLANRTYPLGCGLWSRPVKAVGGRQPDSRQ